MADQELTFLSLVHQLIMVLVEVEAVLVNGQVLVDNGGVPVDPLVDQVLELVVDQVMEVWVGKQMEAPGVANRGGGGGGTGYGVHSYGATVANPGGSGVVVIVHTPTGT